MLGSEGYLSVPNLGAYSEIEWQVARTVGVTVGLRYDRVAYRFESYVRRSPRQETTFDHLSPRLSAVWSPNSATSLYTSVAHGVRGPRHRRAFRGPGPPLPVGASQIAVELRGGRSAHRGRPRAARRVRLLRRCPGRVPSTARSTIRAAGERQPLAQHRRRAGRDRTCEPARSSWGPAIHSWTSGCGTIPRWSSMPPGRLVGRFRRQTPSGGTEAPAHRLRPASVPCPPWISACSSSGRAWCTSKRQRRRRHLVLRVTDGRPVEQVDFRAVPARALVHLNAAWRLRPGDAVRQRRESLRTPVCGHRPGERGPRAILRGWIATPRCRSDSRSPSGKPASEISPWMTVLTRGRGGRCGCRDERFPFPGGGLQGIQLANARSPA